MKALLLFFSIFTGLFFGLMGQSLEPELIITNDRFGSEPNPHEIQLFVPKKGKVRTHEVLAGNFDRSFSPYTIENRRIQDIDGSHWLKINLRNATSSNGPFYLEFVDSHINRIRFYQKDKEGNYTEWITGRDYPFDSRPFDYKNFVFPVNLQPEELKTLWVNIESESKTSLVFKIRNDLNLIKHQKREYTQLGIFYGMLAIMLLYNFFLFLFVKERTYLYYVIYLMVCGFLFLTEDGFGYQFIWSDYPVMNNYINNYTPILLLPAFFLYAGSFLELKHVYPSVYKQLAYMVTGFFSLFILFRFFSDSPLFYLLYFIPFGLIYYYGWIRFKSGYRPARYFIIAHLFVLTGLVFLVFRKNGISLINHPITVYSLNIGFVIEICVLSYALGEKMKLFKIKRIKAQERLLRQFKEKQITQRKLVEQLQENEKLKDKVNRELENEVSKRTHEIAEQKEIIEKKNSELLKANEKLKEQSEQIQNMNVMLDLDNYSLKKDLKKVARDRVMSKSVDFEEFQKIYPDKLACLRFLSELKWSETYECKKCGHQKFCNGKNIFSHRCTRCRYEESPTAYTIFHKCKFSIVKAFYMVFLVYTNKGEISSQELSQRLDLRQSTCWNFKQKILKAMEDHKKDGEASGEGWGSIILDAEKIMA